MICERLRRVPSPAPARTLWQVNSYKRTEVIPRQWQHLRCHHPSRTPAHVIPQQELRSRGLPRSPERGPIEARILVSPLRIVWTLSRCRERGPTPAPAKAMRVIVNNRKWKSPASHPWKNAPGRRAAPPAPARVSQAGKMSDANAF